MCSKAVLLTMYKSVLRPDSLKVQPFSSLRFVANKAYVFSERDVFRRIPSVLSCLASSNSIGLKCSHAKFSSQLPKESPTDDLLKSKISQKTDEGSEEKGSDKKAEKDKWYSGRNAWKVGLAALSLSGLISAGSFLFVFGAPVKGEDGNDIIDEYSNLSKWIAYPKRAFREMQVFKKMIQDPSSEKLLPDELKDPWYQPPYTLVIEMTGVLVHPDWTLATGWRFKKRPGLNHFLQELSPYFEIVVYTHEQGLTAFPIIDSMDPEGRITYRLFRDATRYMDGTHVKDLSALNRDLKKVVIVDCNSKAMSLQPENGFLLQKWTGDDSDRKLVDLAAFLKIIATHNVEDVRQVLEHYAQFEDPISAFKENRKTVQFQLEEKEEKKSPPANRWLSGFGKK